MNVHERDYHDLVVIARLTGTRTGAAAELNVIAHPWPKHIRKTTGDGQFKWKT